MVTRPPLAEAFAMHRNWTLYPCSVRTGYAAFCFLLAATLLGCSSSSATVNGKVTANGKNVTQGTLVFAPLATDGHTFPGKSGMAAIQSDGSYSLELQGGSNGLANRFAVRFTPEPIHVNSKSKDVVVPYQGLTPKQAAVEVKPGINAIDIELIPIPEK
jgi:hypothetical protein